MNFCSHCGNPVSLIIPPGDDRSRHVCCHCDRIHYQNPRIITGCLPLHGEQVLLCRRAIEPRHGLWTLPAGFLENGETIEQGALRESLEEANAPLQSQGLYAMLDIPRIHQIYFFFRASFVRLEHSPGQESLETRLFAEADIPWESLAFPVIERVLRHYFQDRQQGEFPLRTGVIS